ncbi:MMPL family transporter [Gordonia sp. ABSL1-1]|uniref:MMPL family transporter n=1 Tax=Gordonia sp. ABSL1-1 TaxID=3053923 RepID=UPI002573CA62|nr:MMPL family transporter [Gordonia sp. ABSL1-1]MDL9935159.1 MMPL family transporter [Gordonia sp. ABSL1-1]
MFGAIGTFVYRMRFAVIAVLVAMMAGLGLFGLDLSKHLSQSGWFDPTSESVKGSIYADNYLGRDHKSDIVLFITPPEGTTVDDPAFGVKVEDFVNDLAAAHPDIVNRNDPGIFDPFTPGVGQSAVQSQLFTPDKKHAFISIGVAGNDDTTILANFKKIEPFFDDIPERFDMPGATFELAGLQPVAGSMADGMDKDIHRAEVIALPIVALMLFFIFGGVIAACLPVLIGGLTIAGSLGIMKILALTTELNIFAQSVVTLIGLGIAIDYGLFIVSRFREELGEGYSTKAAVRRTVMTAGQTVVFSATIIVAALACLLIMPQGFLKSVAYGAIASVSLAALLSITVLPAILSILGPRIDALSIRTIMGWTLIPIVRKLFGDDRANALDSRFTGRIKSREDVENGFWGKLSGWVMQHPVATAVPTVLLLLALIIPFGNIAFGGISEKYLPPDNANRVAQEHFDEAFPTQRTEAIMLVVIYDPNTDNADADLQAIAADASKAPGLTGPFSTSQNDRSAQSGTVTGTDYAIIRMSAGLKNRDDAAAAIDHIRSIDKRGAQVYVAGTPTLTQDSIDALMKRLPLMAIMLVSITGLLMFLAFGSVVLPIKAALMSALGLGSTLGILTWIFVDGHGSSLANFTPGPLFAAILVLIIAIVFGLSTDYEIFLLSRMVEARQKGASTTEAIRVGTAHTGGIITAAAAILVVVIGAFGLSEIVMMKYIAYGMIAALILDATVIRMLLVPSVMKLLGDDCWWAPRWMRTLQEKIGLGEAVLDDEPDELRDGVVGSRAMSAGTMVAEAPTSVMRRQLPVPHGARRGPAPQPARQNPAAQAPPVQAAPAAPAVPNRAAPNPAGPTPRPVGPRTPLVGNDPASRLAPRPEAPTADSAPVRRPVGSTERAPDTGSWSLGDGGIRLQNPAQPPSPAQAPPTPQPERPVPPAPAGRPAATGSGARTTGPVPVRGTTPADRPVTPDSADARLRRRPDLGDSDRGPLAASLAPEGSRPTSGQQNRGEGNNMGRGLSPDAVSAADAGPRSALNRGPDTLDADTRGTRPRNDESEGGRRRSDRHARSADDDSEGNQISVQDLLRRSRSEH